MNYKFREIREDKELKQHQVANAINKSRGAYANIEAETANIKLNELLTYCNHFGLSMDYVCRLTNKINYDFIKIKKIDKKVMASRLNEIEQEQKLLAKDIALELGIGKTTYSYYKSMTRSNLMQTLMLKHLCSKYGYSMDWVVGRSSKKYF